LHFFVTVGDVILSCTDDWSPESNVVETPGEEFLARQKINKILATNLCASITCIKRQYNLEYLELMRKASIYAGIDNRRRKLLHGMTEQ
jgi:hypothetical protein